MQYLRLSALFSHHFVFSIISTLFFTTAAARTMQSSAGKQIIVVSLPEDKYYRDQLPAIAAFGKELATKAEDYDEVVVLFPKKFMKKVQAEQGNDSSSASTRYGGHDLGNATVLTMDKNIDLWMRDFGLGLPGHPVKFKYSPVYLSRSDARFVDNAFRDLLASFKIPVQESNLFLDGGNVVDNGKDKAIVSDRFFYENQKVSEKVLTRELEQQLGMKVAVIPDPEDTTGHADGVVSFIDDNVLLIADYCDAVYYKLVADSVKEVFPDLKIIKLPCEEEKKEKKGKKSSKWRGFSSAVGAYVNILLTDSSVYIPVFGNEKRDKEVLDLVRANTSRRVVHVDTSKLSHMGGSVRCMTWQIQASQALAMALIDAAEK